MALQAYVSSLPDDTPLAVLDTNVVLACWWFQDPSVRALGNALEGGVLRWKASMAMRQELAAVLQRVPSRQACDPPAAKVLVTFDRLVTVTTAANTMQGFLCTDASDQIFIDLALAEGARWLFSRDRAVLKLRRRAAARGLCICPPQDWSLDDLKT